MSFYVYSHAVTRQMPKGALKVTPSGTSEWLVAESDMPARIHAWCTHDSARATAPPRRFAASRYGSRGAHPQVFRPGRAGKFSGKGPPGGGQ